jgi:hypothetical protein
MQLVYYFYILILKVFTDDSIENCDITGMANRRPLSK